MYLCVSVFVSLRTYLHTHTHAQTHTHTHAHMHAHALLQIYTCMYLCIIFIGRYKHYNYIMSGVVAEWIRHSAFNAVVAGSNPCGSG